MLKFIDLRKTPSLEFGMMLVFSYAPYCLAEGIHLSGVEFPSCVYYSLGAVICHYELTVKWQLTFGRSSSNLWQ